LDRALAEIAAGAKLAQGKDQGSLLALSGLVRLDKALGTGKKLTPTSPGVAEARKDAQAAITAGAEAEGNYALGRLAEELGDLTAAAKHFAVAAKYQGRKDLASMYRLALARVLLKTGAPAEGEKKEEKTPSEKVQAPRRPNPARAALMKWAVALRDEEAVSPVAQFCVPNIILVNPEGDDEDQAAAKNPNVEQAIRLAQEAIDLGDPQGHLLLGIALTKRGEWTKGLQEYITGLEKVCPGPATRDLRSLVEGHPAFRTPESVKPPQPLLAEKHFSLGLDYFQARQYARAEREFLETVKFYGKDARYQYYLGLSRLLQQNPDKLGTAYENFRLGKRLEDQGNPDSAEVDAALEKVQGKARRTLSRFRKP